MTEISFIISPFGLGHLTREIALAKAINDLDPKVKLKFIISEEHQKIIPFLKNDLTIETLTLPYAPIIHMSTHDEIDIETSIDTYQRSWDFGSQLNEDLLWGKLLQNSDIIINDIESMHNPIAKKMGKRVVNVSNFTWSDIIRRLGSGELADQFGSLESLADFHIQLPLNTECKSFNNPILGGYLTRTIDPKKVKSLQENRKNKKLIFINNVSSHLQDHFKELVENLNKLKLVPIIPESFVESLSNLEFITYAYTNDHIHDLIAASHLIICKSGYSTFAETIIGATYSFHWVRKNFEEDINLSSAVQKLGFGEQINYDIQVDELIERIKYQLTILEDKPLVGPKDDNLRIGKMVLELLNQ